MAEIDQNKRVVDVVIPAFNAEKYIEETLASVALQGELIRSIIVVNDGSTDNTAEKVNAFSKAHPSLIIELINQQNCGLANARNAGILASHASYIALLDADDLWVKDKLQKQLNVFNEDQNPKLGVVYCAYELINQDSRPMIENNLTIQPQVRGAAYSKLKSGNFISGSGSSVLIKANIFKEVGYFDESLSASEDWDMWIRISEKYEFDFVSDVLVQIRVHDNNMQKNFSRMLSSELAMLNKFEKNGVHNYFLLCKIQTILYRQKMVAQTIAGFEISEPWVKSHLTGIRRSLWHLAFFLPSLIWEPLRLIKKNIPAVFKFKK